MRKNILKNTSFCTFFGLLKKKKFNLKMTHFPASVFIEIWADKIFMLNKLPRTIEWKMIIYFVQDTLG
jgi:hypothetical protein